MAELRDEKLDLWLRRSWNVLLEGRHGVGKTERIKAALKRTKLNWRYFAGGTLDPWVDFVGIPQSTVENGRKVIELIRPAWHYEPVELLFIDEFNRAHSKVQNACFELIQYQTINGLPLSSLKMIWVAINPQYEEEYNVEKLDKALRDRFRIQFEVDNLPCPIYFTEKYPEEAKGALAWWHELPATQKLEVSPRRLEDAIIVHQGMGDLNDCLPKGSNVTKLIQLLNVGPAKEKLLALFRGKNTENARQFLGVENNFAQAKRYILVRPDDAALYSCGIVDWQNFFVPLLRPEKISCLISESPAICKLVCENAHKEPAYTQAMHEILRAGTNRKLIKEIKKHLKGTNILVAQYAELTNNIDFEEPYFNKGVSNAEWDALVAIWKSNMLDHKVETTPQRVALYKQVHDQMPEKLNSRQAQDTLDLLGMIAGRCWPHKIKDMKHLVGMVNHCIMSIHEETRLDWIEMLKVYGPCLGNVLGRLEKGNLQHRVMCPLTQTPGIGELILERKGESLEQQT
jgi:AAA domain (dynein-related subfamily)